MSETRTLLTKISALRQRLDQAQGLANEARSAATALLAGIGDEAANGGSFEGSLRAAGDKAAALDVAIRPVVSSALVTPQPQRLTARARRVLEQGRDLLGTLKFRHIRLHRYRPNAFVDARLNSICGTSHIAEVIDDNIRSRFSKPQNDGPSNTS